MLLVALIGKGQQEHAIWYFSDGIGLDFNTSPPTSLFTTPLNTVSASITHSDVNGSLLYYSNGEEIWDASNTLVKNGAWMRGSEETSNGGILIPKPGSDTILYLFTTPPIGFFYQFEFNYHELNTATDTLIRKNDNLATIGVCDMVAAIERCDGSYWVVTHEYMPPLPPPLPPAPGTNRFYAYPVTSAGVGVAVESDAGSLINSDFLFSGMVGQMKFSPQGDKLVVASSDLIGIGGIGVELFDFNITTGEVSNPLTITNAARTACFSEDGSKLYVVESDRIFQYDMLASDILASRTPVSVVAAPEIRKMERAIDGKIYVLKDNFAGNTDAFDVINSPNNSGAASDYVNDVFVFPSTIQNSGLPNFPELVRTEGEGFFLDISSCDGDSIKLQPPVVNAAANYLWSTGETTFSIEVDISGEYFVDITYDGCTIRDTFYVENSLAYQGTTREYFWCAGDNIELTGDLVGTNYAWFDEITGPLGIFGPNEDTITVVDTGTYYLEVFLAPGCTDRDTFEVRSIFDTPPQFQEVQFCEGATGVEIETEVGGANYNWSTGEMSQMITAPAPGIYAVEVTLNACTRRDSFDVFLYELFPRIIDTLVCDENEVVLSGGSSDAGYLWSTGSIAQNATVNASGLYTVVKGDSGCLYNDSITLTLVTTSPEATTLRNCLASSEALSARFSEQGYLWNTGASEQTIAVDRSGGYNVQIVLDGCVTVDSFEVYVNQSWQAPDIISDTILCEGDELLIALNQSNTTYVWDNGSSLANRTLTDAGLYWVETTNECGTLRDTVVVDVEECPCTFYVPSAFSPNGDGDNDVFKGDTDCELLSYELQVYDRWGDVMYQSENGEDGWDGTNEGIPVPIGIYVYNVRYTMQYQNAMKRYTGQTSGKLFLRR